VDARAGQAESDLESRGYEHHHTSKHNDGSWSYWWNSSKKKCVSILTYDGRYTKINDAEAEDCGKKSGMGTGTKIAIALAAAAAVGGTAAIIHKAHDHDDGRHWDDPKHESDFERGHRDGLYNMSYHNWNSSKEYTQGFTSGVAQRNQNTSHHSGWGGYRPHVYVGDISGARGSSGESDLQSRGFRNVNTFKSGDTSYQIWFNGSTRQCVQGILTDGRYTTVRELSSGSPYCR